ncbi:hypothetical protein DRO66_04745 [Candidatus Bathyarchaeota archaeon]|nr:MAG: hypothetical protein DRO66_04745 [Candidatus Bathyarchaeota archaeon]
MSQSNLMRYGKRMIPSLLLMVLITYGIKENIQWLQYGSIVILLAGQMGYQVIKTVRSKPMMDANVEEARKASRRKILLRVTKSEIDTAKARGKAIGGMSPKMSLMFVVPLVMYLGSGYVLSYFIPGIPRWQSYLVGFLITMPVSMTLQAKMGVSSMTSVASPNTYSIGEKGIIFEHMGQYHILNVPFLNLEVKEESNCIEVEGHPTKTSMIPNKVRLFNGDLKRLQNLLKRFIEA